MKHTTKNFFQILFLTILLLGVVTISNAARPGTAPNDNPELLYSGTYIAQSKAGTLILKNVANPTISSGFTFEADGSITATGAFVPKISGTGGNVFVKNTIKSDTLSGTGLKELCSDQSGAIIRCP